MLATHLRVNYLDCPLDLGDPKPRFYWKAEGGVAQTSYQITVKNETETLWDSGTVQSAAMTHIQYAGRPLHSREQLTWSVRLWDEHGNPG